MSFTSKKFNFDETVSIVQHYAYSSFGKLLKISDANGNDVTAAPPVKTSYGYTNREHDEESGLMYYRARYYQPEIGRFISEDAHQGDMKAPRTKINKYIYALNNPNKYVDPSGNFVFTAAIIGAVIGGYMAHTSGGNVLEGMLIGALAGAVGAYAGKLGYYIGSQGPAGVLGNKILGSIIGVQFGAIAGTMTGRVIGGNLAVMRGDSFQEGSVWGGNIGGTAGAVTGGLYGYSSNVWGADQYISEYLEGTYLLFKHAGSDPMALVMNRPWVVTSTVLLLANEFVCEDDERYNPGQGCID